MTPSVRVLGRGWNFPVIPDPASGRLLYVSGAEKVRQSIQLILDTEPGERIMRPAFGCGLRRYLMKPNTPTTRALIQSDVESALASFEPRIRVTRISVDPGEDEPSLALIQIAYVHLADSSTANFVYPFYLD
jgi:phage baseplate assembly protein W